MIGRFTRHLTQLSANPATSGLVMLACAIFAMLLANSAAQADYLHFIALPLGSMQLDLFVKDVLMAVFFLQVGMELKREMREGFLAQPGQKLLPLIAALGGIALPALVYLGINSGIAAHTNGWAIPTATDIAFAICVISLLGKRVPAAAKIFLLAIAIYDDLAAILIIALFYSKGVALLPLAIAAGITAGMYLLNRRGISHLLLYLLLGAALWHFVHEAGIHTTVAGMITGLMIPLQTRDGRTPLPHLMHLLHPWVGFLILPLFAFVSAGVDLRGITPAAFTEPLTLGIAAGLFFGKQLGIFVATFLAVKLGLATRPAGTNWATLYGVAIIAGVGFTMSLFIGFLAFHDATLHNAVKLGVIVGSLASALWGMLVLRLATARSA